MKTQSWLMMGIFTGLLATTAGSVAAAPCKGPGMYPGMAPGYGYGPLRGPYGPYGPRHPMWGGPGYYAGPAMPHRRAGPVMPQRQAEGPTATTAAEEPTSGGAASTTTTGDAASESAVVSIRGMQFNPPRVVVKKGGTVSWKQADGMPHTVTADDGGFSSSRLSAGGEFSQIFDEPGRYTYYCGLHPSMRGEVVVVE